MPSETGKTSIEETPERNSTSSKTDDSAIQQLSERLYSFRFTYISIAAFILLYIFSIRGLESFLTDHFTELSERAIAITDFDRPIGATIQFRVKGYVDSSAWTTLGGVEVAPLVLGRDGATLIYVAGRIAYPVPVAYSASDLLAEAEHLLPATVHVDVIVPHNSLIANIILIGYASIMITVLWLRNRSIVRGEIKQLMAARIHREESEQRANRISDELDEVRRSFHTLEPTEPELASEVGSLREERKMILSQLASLEAREVELRGSAAQGTSLASEISALEDLLEEASEDLSTRDAAIQDLEKSLKRASKDVAASEASRGREAGNLAKRFSVLYRNLEIDDRAVQDFVALRDEGMKLKGEEKLKRLNDEADDLAVRRKVGGLPSHLTIFEMGFAGKGRLYYTKGNQRRYRVLNVGAKNTQNAALEYLRKL